MIGYELVGSGGHKVMVLNDWLCNTSTWDGARPYLDTNGFTWAFADLRGYGRSKGIRGEYSVEEAAADALSVADALEWDRFAIVGHSMSTLVAVHLAQQHSNRIERAVVLTPPPPAGFGADDATLDAMRAVALGDDEKRTSMTRAMWGDRLSAGWLGFKVERWRACSDREAVAGYVRMFGREGVPNPGAPVAAPVLAVTGEQDAEVMRAESVSKFLAPICADLTVVPLAECGHYPMQEMPALLVSIVERFLRGESREPTRSPTEQVLEGTDDIRIRRADTEDLSVLARFGHGLARLHISFDERRFVAPEDPEATFVRFFAREIARPEAVLLVAEAASTPVGYAFVRMEEESLEDLRGEGAWLHDLYVEPDARGGGVGRRLVEAAIEAARELGSKSLMLAVSPRNEGARRLFERTGLRTTMLEMRLELDE